MVPRRSMIQWLCCKPGVNTLLESFVSKFRIDRAPACATSRAHRYPTSTFEEFSLFSDFSASPFVSFASATSFCILFAARFLYRRRGAPFTFAPPGPVTPTAFGFTSLVSILYSTSSPYARVITVNHRQSRALARQKSPGVVPSRPGAGLRIFAFSQRFVSPPTTNGSPPSRWPFDARRSLPSHHPGR